MLEELLFIKNIINMYIAYGWIINKTPVRFAS